MPWHDRVPRTTQITDGQAHASHVTLEGTRIGGECQITGNKTKWKNGGKTHLQLSDNTKRHRRPISH